MSAPRLYQFRFSHFNEKARWGLDFKGLPHTRVSALPGLHIPGMILRTGRRQTPALRLDGRVICGSGAILEALEQHQPSPPLFPTEPQAAAEVRRLCAWIDDEVGAPSRCAFFHDFLDDGDYAARVFATGQPPWLAWIYRAMFPVTRAVMRVDMRVNAANAERGRQILAEALDRVVERAGVHGYLVGERFTAADLTAAAILQIAALPPEFPVRLPEPRSAGVSRWLARWEGHPGVAWIQRQYRQHRGISAEIPRRGPDQPM